MQSQFRIHRAYNKILLLLAVPTNAHLKGKIELAKIGEWSEQNSQLYFVPLEVLVSYLSDSNSSMAVVYTGCLA